MCIVYTYYIYILHADRFGKLINWFLPGLQSLPTDFQINQQNHPLYWMSKIQTYPLAAQWIKKNMEAINRVITTINWDITPISG